MTLSEALERAGISCDIPENIKQLEIIEKEKILPLQFYPWLREVYGKVLDEIANEFDDFSKNSSVTSAVLVVDKSVNIYTIYLSVKN